MTGPSGAGAAGRAIAVGAGPQRTYAVRQQSVVGSCHYRCLKGEPLEDPKCTPGAVSQAVTQANLKSTIRRTNGCTSGIRPSTSVTGREKKLSAASYGFTGRMGDASASVRSTRPSERCLLGGRVLRAVGTVGIGLGHACGARSALASRTAWDA